MQAQAFSTETQSGSQSTAHTGEHRTEGVDATKNKPVDLQTKAVSVRKATRSLNNPPSSNVQTKAACEHISIQHSSFRIPPPTSSEQGLYHFGRSPSNLRTYFAPKVVHHHSAPPHWHIEWSAMRIVEGTATLLNKEQAACRTQSSPALHKQWHHQQDAIKEQYYAPSPQLCGTHTSQTRGLIVTSPPAEYNVNSKT
ncbi:hypothetical protein DQ04_10541000 [Trypanosoma grayi]|uniref:hypothetical protein n=1 Tax=Trypanosoma grayi TaxID=71804 RepID=UPI0004F4A09E|nr:hypothetical protein DQ04_10541000 [Trypanosoma grayi]KEG07214.1 hypothetical protein DQ04_10541000 [Trypanosoma grayi]